MAHVEAGRGITKINSSKLQFYELLIDIAKKTEET